MGARARNNRPTCSVPPADSTLGAGEQPAAGFVLGYLRNFPKRPRGRQKQSGGVERRVGRGSGSRFGVRQGIQADGPPRVSPQDYNQARAQRRPAGGSLGC